MKWLIIYSKRDRTERFWSNIQKEQPNMYECTKQSRMKSDFENWIKSNFKQTNQTKQHNIFDMSQLHHPYRHIHRRFNRIRKIREKIEIERERHNKRNLTNMKSWAMFLHLPRKFMKPSVIYTDKTTKTMYKTNHNHWAKDKQKKNNFTVFFASLFEREIQNLYTVFNFLYPAVISRYAFTSLINEFIRRK